MATSDPELRLSLTKKEEGWRNEKILAVKKSPSTSKVHSGQGLTLTPACKKKLQVADAMVESGKESIS